MAPKKVKESEMLTARAGIVNSFSRNKSYITKHCAAMTNAELEARLSLIESNYSQFCNIQAKIEQDSDDASEYESRQAIEELYCEIKAKLLSSISRTGRRQSNANDTLNSSHMVRSSKLPTLKIPEFSGKFTEWTSWYSMFCTLIDNDSELDDLAKFMHLKSYLGPVPLGTIECLELSEANYKLALKLLQARFENKSIILQSHINELFNVKRLKNADSDAIRVLVDSVNAQLAALKSLGDYKVILEAIIFHLVRSKLDDETVERWENDWDCSKLPSWQLLSQYLTKRGINLANRDVRRTNGVRSNGKNDSKKASLAAAVGSNHNNSCYCCSGTHRLQVCPKFCELSPVQRYQVVKKHMLCFTCFSKRHTTKSCNGPRCKVCSKPHHELLHWDGTNVVQNSTPMVPVQQQPSTVHSSLLSRASMSYLATAVVLIKDKDGGYHNCRCVLDSGSQLNFLTSALVAVLGLEMQDTSMRLSGIGNTMSEIVGEVQATFKSRLTRFAATDHFCVLSEITQYKPSSSGLGQNWHPPKGVRLADPAFNSNRNIDMLLGVSLFFKLFVAGQIKLGPNLPRLQKSLLGWVVVGEVTPTSGVSLLVNEVEPKADELHELVQRFWKCEEIPEPAKSLTEEEKQCEQSFTLNVKQAESGQLIVALPFKEPIKVLGDTYQIALTRFLNLERKLSRDQTLKEQYTEFLAEYEELGHLEIVNQAKVHEVEYFMPHHPVMRPESLTTRLRVVFDASCKSSNGVSLNDTMLVGATLQPDLFETLVRFRFYKYAITADITKMYRQVLVIEEHRNFQCILWRRSVADPIQVLRLKTVTYGTNSAPFLAVRCLLYLAEAHAKEFPLAFAAVKQSFYMDDMLCGADSVEVLARLKEEVTELLKRGRFELHKWRSSCHQVLSDAADTEPLRLKTEDAAKTLGISWMSQRDEFQFSYNIKCSATLTKRAVLSELAQIFDPLGFLSPILILGKIFVQELWLLKHEWDEELPTSYAVQWRKYREELKLINQCSLPRSVVPVTAEPESVELFGFSDASNRAYGGVIYARVRDKEGVISVSLVAAKSKVAPVRVTSLPRLELQGALLVTKLMDKVRTCLHLKVKQVRYFTDSTIVLSWLSSHASRWSTFVANRVAQIQELSRIQDWFKVESKANPADIVSRGLYATDLSSSNLWWHGPDFLMNTCDDWANFPKSEVVETVPEERKNTFTLAVSNPGTNAVSDLIGKCKFAHDFLKLQHVFSYIYRWRRAIIKTDVAERRNLTAVEMAGGLRYIVANLQHLKLHEEFTSLQSKKLIKSAKIQCLNPFIETEEGIAIIRVGGRLSKAELPFDIRHPILLPSNHIVVNALISHTHRKNLHAGVQSLCAFLRQKYWIVNCRKLARKTVRSCVVCFRLRPVLGSQLMGSLPASRVRGNIHPFERAGLDFAGPIWMHFNMRGKRPVKVYLCIFVCFLTKACHLEIVSDLSANAFIAALKRFFARRGLSSDLYCDNATNFVGASRELNRSFDRSSQDLIADECSQRGVNFHFIPPRSPHFGGLWESAVKVAKQLLIKCANSTALNYEDLSTAIAQVEAVMNSRPLYPLSSDPNDLEALTPGHFLVGRPLNSLVEPFNEGLVKLSMTEHWKRILVVHNMFWRRWSAEYLTLMQQRTKWRSATTNLQLGTLVLIAEDNSPPGQWLLGRVSELHPGADGAVRVVTLKTKNGQLKRNVHRICPLPVEN